MNRAFFSVLLLGVLTVNLGCAGRADRAEASTASSPTVVYSDLDGTMLDEESRISERNLEAVRAFQAAGGLLSVATGRLPDRAWEYAEQLKVDLPAVFGNGAVILKPDGSLLRMLVFREPEQVQSFCRRIMEAGCSHIYTSIGHSGSGEIRMLDGRCQAPTEDGWGVLKLRARDCKEHDELLAAIRQLNTSNCSVLESGSGRYRGVSIGAPGVGKAEALEHIARLHKLDPLSMVFFGDSGNDTGALRWLHAEGGTCVVMPNGTPDALAACPRQAPASNDQDGVGQTLELLLQGRRP